ncbi:uncharacterized protein Z518_09738 [Rhinocladiella mackenziei CBS 650.93]|uniref:Carboxylic ester hydrolase n=1 Tax=Rhinocladiella mackenziei CBS 650.93 TaxID=1442369 RepID=A0A0D2GQT8_9EURO|nr:uncharacterized protein Z518_09738 [Rhinocladiella mackenziei CBS 650.93]KIX00673.1 hypothetical protein Z518_09738 [Rhinocladiella mackenziei CBS 650.93]
MRSLLILVYLLSTVLAVPPLVRLNYASYRGTALSNGVTQWLGMRYASAPVGELRFASPQDPPVLHGIQAAEKHGLVCLGTAEDPHNPASSEDCLFIDVYAPTRATSRSKLPVYFFIQGGGFNYNANANYNGSGLITVSAHEMLVVTFNYRVGPYGFIASREIRDSATASVNNGLKDQRKALEWVQKYITEFGGDPDHVVLGGDSAGAASIALHLTAYGGRNDGLFVAAAAESVSFATILTIEECQYQYDIFTMRLGCANRTGPTIHADEGNLHETTLSCLRSKSASELQTQNFNTPYPGTQNPPLYMWNPVLDHDLIQNYTYLAFDSGSFIRVPVIFGDDTNGGTVFTPRSTSNLAQSNTFLHDQFPFLTFEHLERINTLFPNHGPTFPHSGPWWRQVSNAYGDIRYMCPNLFISSAFARHGAPGNWNYRYNVRDPAQIAAGLGVPHTVELGAIWGPANVRGGVPASYRTGKSNAWIVPLMQAYWVSFVRSLDPNVHRSAGAPVWDQFTANHGDGDGSDWSLDSEAAVWRRMLFDTLRTTAMENVTTTVQARCKYLSGIGAAIRQ